MNVLTRLWDHVYASQPAPPAWVVGVTALAALLLVLNTASWRLAGKVITIAHEGGHALVSVLSGRRLEGIRLHTDSSGVTYSRGKRRGPGLVLTAAAGYLTPPLLGAGAAALLAARHPAALLWLALVLLAATFLAVRNAFGALAVLVTAAGVFAVSYYASAAVQAGFAYLAAWFLLLGGMRPALELTRRRPRLPARLPLRPLRRRPAGPPDRRLARRVGHRLRPDRHRRPSPGHPPAHPVASSMRRPGSRRAAQPPTAPLLRARYSCYFAAIAHNSGRHVDGIHKRRYYHLAIEAF